MWHWQRILGVPESFGIGRDGAPVGQFDSDWARPADRAEFYREMLRTLVCPATTDVRGAIASGAPFRVQARNGVAGDLLHLDYIGSPHRIERTAADASAAPNDCYFLLRYAAPGQIEIGGEARRLAVGDCVLGDADQPLTLIEGGPLAFSLYLLPKRLVDPWAAGGAERLRQGFGLPAGSPLAAMLDGALRPAADAELAPQTAKGVGAVIGRLMALAADDAAAAAEPVREAVQAGRRAQILRQIEERFAEPLLQPARVAAALGISVRSLHLALEPTGRTFGEHLAAVRLAEARRLIESGLARSMADAAFACGFNDVSTFYRTFRRTYGAAPRDLLPA